MSRLALPAGLLALLPLTGCMNMSGLGGGSKYACAAPEGVACESVSGTYANAVHRQLPSQRDTAASEAAHEGRISDLSAAPVPSRNAIAPARTTGFPAASTLAPQALRSEARYLRLWVKPWEDLDGDLFDQAHVYVQIDSGRWQIDHLRQRIRDAHAPLRPPPVAAPSSQNEIQEPRGGEPSNPTPQLFPSAPRPAADPRHPFPSLGRPGDDKGLRPQ